MEGLQNPSDSSVADITELVFESVLPRLGKTPLGTAAKRIGPATPTENVINRLSGYFLPDRLLLHVGDETHRFHLSTRFEYEQFQAYGSDPDGTVLRQFTGEISPDDVVWDVGANVGVYTVVAASTAETVVAFEPIPENATRIQENLILNGRNAMIQRTALSDSTRESGLQRCGPSGTGAFGLLDETTSEHSLTVRTAPGTDLVSEGVPAPTVVKIDVQGTELAVLSGLSDLLADCRSIYCNVYEKHFEQKTEGEQIQELLSDRGYDVTKIGEWSGGYFIRASRPDGNADRQKGRSGATNSQEC